MTTRRKFLTTGALGGAAALAAPAVVRAQAPIKWRMQTYAGAALGEHVVKPAVEAFNTIAQGQMEIELFYSDQLVPTAELFQAMQAGTIDCVQSDDDSMASPTEVTVFGGYFPLALRYSLDVPALFNKYGLKQIWEEEYAAVGVKHISAGSWDPCNFSTKKPLNSLKDLEGLRVFTFPTAGRFLTQFGVVPVTLPWEDVEVALQTGELDGLAWSGITEVYTVGWANVTDYFLTNNISGAWIGHFFANMERWNAVPPHLQKLLETCFEQSHYYRQHWYWAGEADLRINGGKLKLTTIPDEEWKTVEDAAVKFWDEIAAESEVKAKVVEVIKKYNDTMVKAGPPYRF
ncbi:C4-dicarboxylate ABC transporter [Gemmobacter aquaticus]|jgi:TRAP-type mannitol/chloroaromatic compound transport system substrate-binding protein|uniref:C4-dicarboxylate ABC transporter n=1 Tax=Gemmobacter aquaticus TaxID=490185 RepID=A0A918DBZ3_9RHOB|nr:TRAP transporter substrate-binding protein [Gemmobacter aquaticus]GGO29607.1 C4-dicarboxylate ABC transporter [Gemmobacter aquaticus]